MRRMRRWGPLLCSQLVAVLSGEVEVQGRRCWSHGIPRGFRHGTFRFRNTHGRSTGRRDGPGIPIFNAISELLLTLQPFLYLTTMNTVFSCSGTLILSAVLVMPVGIQNFNFKDCRKDTSGTHNAYRFTHILLLVLLVRRLLVLRMNHFHRVILTEHFTHVVKFLFINITHTRNFFAPVAIVVTSSASPSITTTRITVIRNFGTGTVNDARDYLNA